MLIAALTAFAKATASLAEAERRRKGPRYIIGSRYITGCFDGIKIGEIQLSDCVMIHIPSRQIDRVADRLILIAASCVRPHRATADQIDHPNHAHGWFLIVVVLCSVAVRACKVVSAFRRT
jgi:hypothetical protein